MQQAAAVDHPLVERLCKELLLQHVAVKVAHAGQGGPAPVDAFAAAF
jgi:hypothetical protein